MNTKKDVMDTLTRINRKLFTANNSGDRSLIGKGQIKILKVIADNENITQDNLANELNIDKTTVAKAVKKLEASELITRNQSKLDKRKKELIATEKAYSIIKHMDKHLEEDNDFYFKGLSSEEILAFRTTLDKIEQNIETKRSEMNSKKQIAIKVLKLIKTHENLSVEKLADLLDIDIESTETIISRMTIKKLVVCNKGVLEISENANIFKQEHGLKE